MYKVRIKRYCAGGWEEQEDVVAVEALVEVLLAEQFFETFFCTPFQIRELVYGYLAGLGLVRTAQEILEYQEERESWVGGPEERVRVRIRLRKPFEVQPGKRAFSLLAPPPRLSPRPLFSAQALLDLPKRVILLAEGFRRTGALHSAALFDSTLSVLFFAEDIGRHNAVDKVIGAALLAGKSVQEALLFVSGRIGMDIVAKALRMEIPVIVSPSAPLGSAIALARQANLGLVGFLRGQRFNVYSGEGWFLP